MNLFVNLLHNVVKRLWNVVSLRPVNLASTILTTAEAKQVQTIGNNTSTMREGERGGEGGRERDQVNENYSLFVVTAHFQETY